VLGDQTMIENLLEFRHWLMGVLILEILAQEWF